MNIFLYKKHLISKPFVEKERYVFELLATDEDVIEYKHSLKNTFTTSIKLNGVKRVISINEMYRLELRTEKFIPDLPVYITLKQLDRDIEYFLMIKDTILDLEDGFQFASDPINFLEVVKLDVPDDFKRFTGNQDAICIDSKEYEMTVHYAPETSEAWYIP